jgi:hypothetical protein
MSQLLGTDEATLARALQKKSILESIGGGELFEMSGKELLDAAKSMGASSEQLNVLAKAEDTRSTDEKLSDTLDIMVTKGIRASIVDQESAITGISDNMLAGLEQISNLGDVLGPNLAMVAGYTERASQAINLAADVIQDVKGIVKDVTSLEIGSALDKISGYIPGANGGISTAVQTQGMTAAAPDAIEVKAGYAQGGTVPSGYANDSFIAGLTSGETVLSNTGQDKLSATMLQVGAMIVSAIKSNNVDYGTHFG